MARMLRNRHAPVERKCVVKHLVNTKINNVQGIYSLLIESQRKLTSGTRNQWRPLIYDWQHKACDIAPPLAAAVPPRWRRPQLSRPRGYILRSRLSSPSGRGQFSVCASSGVASPKSGHHRAHSKAQRQWGPLHMFFLDFERCLRRQDELKNLIPV